MRKKVFTKVLTAIAIIATASALTGCGVSYSVSETNTKTVTDADGTTVTTTTVKENNNGDVTTTTTKEVTTEPEQIVATMSFQNDAQFDIYQLGFASALSDEWGNDILGEYAPLEDGETITFHDLFRYTEDDLIWDMKAIDSAGQFVEFTGLDLSDAADPTNINIVLTYDETDGYFAHVE